MNNLLNGTAKKVLVGGALMGIGYLAGRIDGYKSAKEKCVELLQVSEQVGYMKALNDIANNVARKVNR